MFRSLLTSHFSSPTSRLAYFTTFGAIHTAAAAVGIVTGATQVIRTRRDAFHRRMGYAYITAMVIADVSVMTVFEFTGHFNAFHFFALFNLFSMAMALRPMLMKPRPFQWKINHYMWIGWSYVGLCAAGATEFLLRVPKVHWVIATGAGTMSVMIIGGYLVTRFRPKPRVAPAA
jgi:uncharacterized membrane protein